MENSPMQTLPPTPPPEVSIATTVRAEWEGILTQWKRGWVSDAELELLQSYLENERIEIFVNRTKGSQYSWELDWFAAAQINRVNLDFVANRKKHLTDVRDMWTAHCNKSDEAMLQLSLEALKSMVLLNGAAILAALTVLSGQISKPSHGADIAARTGILFCVISLIMTAAGHVITFQVMASVTATIRSALIGHSRHSKVYAISRYLRKHTNKPILFANGLIYGAIAVFGFGSFVCAVILAAT